MRRQLLSLAFRRLLMHRRLDFVALVRLGGLLWLLPGGLPLGGVCGRVVIRRRRGRLLLALRHNAPPG